MGFGEIVLRILGAIVSLGVVLLLAWLVLRFVNRSVPGFSGSSARMIKVLDRVSFGRNSSLLLIRVQDTVMLVACSEHAIEKLCEFDDPEGKLQPPKPAENVNFAAALKDAAAKAGIKPKGRNGGDKP